MPAPKKPQNEHKIRRSVSLSPGLDGMVETLRGSEERTAFLLGAYERVRAGRSRFVPKRENVELMEAKDEAARRKPKKGAPGKESWVRSRSVSFPPEVFGEMDEHRRRLGMDRSRYFTCCLEHVCGVRPHPELFERSMRPW